MQPWVLIAIGAAAVAQLHVSSLGSSALLVIFCLSCAASLLIMELHATFWQEAARQPQGALPHWMETRGDQAIIVLWLVLGLWLVGHSSYLIVSQ
ncbi:MAG TPA: GAP family protein [Acidimicrobiales bacterium]|nr:GAP family protein [Acidimicrobiales bacterium]